MTQQQKTAKQRVTRADSLARGVPRFVITDPEKLKALIEYRRAQSAETPALIAPKKKARRRASAEKNTEGPGGGQTKEN